MSYITLHVKQKTFENFRKRKSDLESKLKKKVSDEDFLNMLLDEKKKQIVVRKSAKRAILHELDPIIHI